MVGLTYVLCMDVFRGRYFGACVYVCMYVCMGVFIYYSDIGSGL
jgi:hypothetical protein